MHLVKHPFFASIVLAFLAFVLLLSSSQRLPWLDDVSDNYFETAITKAGVAYAVTRGVNATVSVLQHSELQLEPAGVGVSIAAGQVLDPLNDMAERLSDVLVLALVSLGVQKLAYSISYDLSLYGFAILLIALAVFRLIPNLKTSSKVVVKLLVCLIVFRLLMPLCAAINFGIHSIYAEPAITAASKTLSELDKELDPLAEDFEEPPQKSSLWTSAKNLGQYTLALKQKLQSAQSYLKDSIEALLIISWWYIALFLLQAILLPVSSLLLVRKVWQYV